MGRLDDIFDFQAHSAGCRSFCELTVDLVLLAKNIEPPEKMAEWERAERVRAARRLTNAPPGSSIDPIVAAEAAIDKYWPAKKGAKKRAPSRWTGRSLEQDAVRVDAIVPGLRMSDFLREAYSRLCWGTHGSGLALVRGILEDVFPGIAIIAVHESGNLLDFAMRLSLDHFALASDVWSKRLDATRATAIAAGNEAMIRSLEETVRLAERES